MASTQSANLLPSMLVEVLSHLSTLVVLLARCAALQVELLGHLEVVLQLVVEVVGQDSQMDLHLCSLACSSMVHPESLPRPWRGGGPKTSSLAPLSHLGLSSLLLVA